MNEFPLKGLNPYKYRYPDSLKVSVPSFEWSGYNWTACMESGRIIHPEMPYMWYDKEQVKLNSKNQIELHCIRKPNDVKYWDGTIFHPTMACGTIRSVEAFSFGTFTAVLKLPQGYGLWPAFWTSGKEFWPFEHDIAEAWSGNNKYFKLFIAQPPYIKPSWRTTTCVHYNECGHKSNGSRNIPLCSTKNPSTNFVEYQLIWKPDSIQFLVNGKVVRTVDKELCEKFLNGVPQGKVKTVSVIFDNWCVDPAFDKVQQLTPMVIESFNYKPL